MGLLPGTARGPPTPVLANWKSAAPRLACRAETVSMFRGSLSASDARPQSRQERGIFPLIDYARLGSCCSRPKNSTMRVTCASIL